MHHSRPRTLLHGLAIAAAALLTSACAMDVTGNINGAGINSAGASEYQVKLAEYNRIHGASKAEADALSRRLKGFYGTGEISERRPAG